MALKVAPKSVKCEYCLDDMHKFYGHARLHCVECRGMTCHKDTGMMEAIYQESGDYRSNIIRECIHCKSTKSGLF